MGFLLDAWEKKESGVWLALLRIFLGGILLYAGFQKITNPAFAIDKVMAYFASKNPYPWYRDFLTGYAIPQSGLFALLVVWGELLLGGALILGFLTNLVALITFFMFLNYHFAASWISSASLYLHLIIMATSLIFALAGAGKALSLDQLLGKRFPGFYRWTGGPIYQVLGKAKRLDPMVGR